MSFPFAIGGTPIDGSSTLPPLKYQGASFSLEDIDSASTGRNQQGTMIRDRVATKIKWNLEFAPMTTSQLGALMHAIQGQSFSFTYPNVLSGGGGVISGTFYVGQRSAPVWKIDRNNSSGGLWGNVTFNLIEM